MLSQKLALMTTISLCISAVSASASTITWDWGNLAGGPVGSSVYATAGTPASGILLTDRGYDSDGTPHQLFWKIAGSDEHGIGFVGTSSSELTLTADGSAPANFMQIDVSPIYLTFDNAGLRIQSVTGTEAWDLWGTNTLGTLVGATQLINGSTQANVFTAFPAWGTYAYYDLTVHPDPSHAADNVLLDAVQADSSVPEPSTATLLLVGTGLVVLSRRWTRARP